MNPIKVLIVEDELLISESIKLYLLERQHEVVGMAVNYEQAVSLIHDKEPDIVLIDIRLYGHKSGLDVAGYLNNLEQVIPFVILSSQYDQSIISQATQAGAAGYLTKPISKESLWSTIELVAHKAQIEAVSDHYIEIKIKKGRHRIPLHEINYIKSDHVYVEIVCDNSKFFSRYSLREMLNNLNRPNFIRCHRSYIVNTSKITTYSSSKVWIQNIMIL